MCWPGARDNAASFIYLAETLIEQHLADSDSDNVQYNTIQYNTIQCNTIQYNTIQYSTIQYYTIVYNTMQCNTMQYNTIQYNTIQYNTIERDREQNLHCCVRPSRKRQVRAHSPAQLVRPLRQRLDRARRRQNTGVDQAIHIHW